MKSNLIIIACRILLCKTIEIPQSISSKERPVNPGEVPYHLTLYYLDNYLCGGTLVTINNTQAVITSGVCVTQIPPSNKLLFSEHIQVVAGKISFNATEDQTNNVQYRNVANILRHDSWHRDPVPYNDVAIIFLEKDFELNSYVQPIYLQMTKEAYKNATKLIISGFGSSSKPQYSPVLQIAEISTVSNDTCNKVYRHACIRRNISEESFCLGIPRHSEYQAACIADEGSPAVGIINGTLYLVGIFTFGQPYCGRVYQPSVYTNLSYYSTWIAEAVSKPQQIHKIVKRSPVVKYRMKYRNPKNDLRKPKRKLPGFPNYRTVKQSHRVPTSYFRGSSPSFPTKQDFSYPSEDLSSLVRVDGGRDAEAGEVPYQVIVLFNGWYICSGAIVTTPSNKQVVLTSADCVSWRDLGEGSYVLRPVERFTIKAGVLNRTISECYEQSRTVVKTIVYPDFNNDTLEGNLGVIFLNEPFIISLFVKPIKMPSEQDLKVPANTILKVSGWGHKTEDQNALTEVLQIADVPTISNEDCIKRINTSVIFKYTICSDKGPCWNDDGAPAVAEDPKSGAAYVAGVFSWTKRICGGGLPRVYTSVSPFLSWVDDEVCTILGCP